MTRDELEPADLAGRRRIRRVENISNIKNRQQYPSKLQDQPQGEQWPQDGQCDIKGAEQGVIVPYRLPPGSEVTGLNSVIAELRAIERTLNEHKSLFEDIRSYLSYRVPPESANLLETQQETTVATPGLRNTISQDTVTDGVNPGYDEVEVWNSLGGRKAQRAWLVNDGVQGTGKGDSLFLRISPDGKNFSPEFIMILGEIRIASDVYAIRFRSPTQGITLRASEREIYPPYVTSIENTFTTAGSSNKTNFTAQNVGVGVVDSILPNITVPDGYALIIRSNVNNGGQIYVSRTDATVPAGRNTLAAGDAMGLFITNANLVHVAGTLGAQTVDLTAEQI